MPDQRARRYCRPLALLLLCTWMVAAVAADRQPDIEWSKCPENARAGSAAGLRCGWLRTGERLDSRAIELRVVVLQRRPQERDPNPVIFIPGGPGDAAGLNGNALQRWRRWQQRAGWPHDIILFDPRGTGQSRPRPHCGAVRAPMRPLDHDAATVPEPDEWQSEAAQAKHCRQALASDTAARLGPDAQLADIEALLDALDVRAAHLWAISYGTRIARLFAARHPERVRAMALDSVYPFGQNDMLALPLQIQSAIDGLIAACAREAMNCASRHPRRVLATLLARYEEAPARIRLEGDDYLGRRAELTPYRLLLSLVLAGAAGEAAPVTVARLERAVRGDTPALAPLLQRLQTRVSDRTRSEAVFWSTRCAFESARVVRAKWRATLRRTPLIAPYVAEAIDANVCDDGSVPRVGAPERNAQIPTLVVVGEADAATPPAWAESFLAGHPNARSVRVAAAGHAPTLSNACTQRVVERFWSVPGAPLPDRCETPAGDQSGR